MTAAEAYASLSKQAKTEILSKLPYPSTTIRYWLKMGKTPSDFLNKFWKLYREVAEVMDLSPEQGPADEQQHDHQAAA